VFPDLISTLTTPPLLAPSPSTWLTYVATLPEWENALLHSVAFVDQRKLLDSLRSATLLYLASDGGAADSKGSSSAVMATYNHILVECGGRAQGTNPRSFRAEGYGILAVLRLVVFHLRYFYVTRNTNLRFHLYCNSERLLKRIEASRSLCRSVPRRFLYSEVDVEMQILAAIQAVGSVVQFEPPRHKISREASAVRGPTQPTVRQDHDGAPHRPFPSCKYSEHLRRQAYTRPPHPNTTPHLHRIARHTITLHGTAQMGLPSNF
jgi:hypothetical protein